MQAEAPTFRPDVLHELFKLVWEETSKEAVEAEGQLGEEAPFQADGPKKKRNTAVNAQALRLSCELLRLLVSEAIGRAALVAEAEGDSCIEGDSSRTIAAEVLEGASNEPGS